MIPLHSPRFQESPDGPAQSAGKAHKFSGFQNAPSQEPFKGSGVEWFVVEFQPLWVIGNGAIFHPGQTGAVEDAPADEHSVRYRVMDCA